MKGINLFFGMVLMLFVSCNIQAPLENINQEANNTPLPYIILKSDSGIINISSPVNFNGQLDSVVSTSLIISRFSPGDTTIRVKVADKTRKLHKTDFFKNGKFVTGVILYDADNNLNNSSSNITSGRYLNGRVLFDYKHKPDELIVLWQNVEIPDTYMKFSTGGFSVLIPKEAKAVKSSYIRIFGVSDSCKTTDLRVTLVYGIPVII